MAEINVERKGKSPLPWILALLALALVAFLLMQSCGDDGAEADPANLTDTTTAVDAIDQGLAPVPAPVPETVEPAAPAATETPGL